MNISFIRIIFLFLIFFAVPVNANNDIVYINLNELMNNSNVGKFINSRIETEEKKFLEKFKKIEENLRNKENKILSQKNILKKEEFQKQIVKLQDEVKVYRKERKKTHDDLKNKKIQASRKIIQKLNPILTNYMEENSISLILRKKDIIVGKNTLDITQSIIKLLNKEIKEIKF